MIIIVVVNAKVVILKIFESMNLLTFWDGEVEI